MALTVRVSSGTEMIDRMAVSFSIRIVMFTIAGSTSMVISGRMMRRSVCACGEAHAVGRLEMALGDRVEAGAPQLGIIGGGVDRQREDPGRDVFE